MLDLARISEEGSLARTAAGRPAAGLVALAVLIFPLALIAPVLSTGLLAESPRALSVLSFSLAMYAHGDFFFAGCFFLFAAVFPGWVLADLARVVFHARRAADDKAGTIEGGLRGRLLNRAKWFATGLLFMALLLWAALFSGLAAALLWPGLVAYAVLTLAAGAAAALVVRADARERPAAA